VAEKVGFLAISDTHVGSKDAYPEMQEKQNLIPMMKQYIENPENNIKTILISGDLTTGGANLGRQDAADFERIWWKPLKESADKVGAKIALAPGNHDWDSRQWRPSLFVGGVSNTAIIDFVIRNCAGFSPAYHPWSIYYSFDVGGVHFATPGVYPSEGCPNARRWGVFVNIGSRKWLKRDLESLAPDTPTILFYHYPLCGGFAYFWKKSEKEAFLDMIKGKNILALIVGHIHGDRDYTVPGGFWEINVSGTTFLFGSYSSDNKLLTCYRVDSEGNKIRMNKPPVSEIDKEHAAENEWTTALY
jgi:3',5'-cyclic AMP phosphodiesterase CpdA